MEDTGGAAQFDNATVDKALRKAITDQDVDAVRRLLATPGYRYPATPTAVFSLVAAQRVTVGHGRSAHADPPSVQLYRRRGRDMLLALVAASRALRATRKRYAGGRYIGSMWIWIATTRRWCAR